MIKHDWKKVIILKNLHTVVTKFYYFLYFLLVYVAWNTLRFLHTLFFIKEYSVQFRNTVVVTVGFLPNRRYPNNFHRRICFGSFGIPFDVCQNFLITRNCTVILQQWASNVKVSRSSLFQKFRFASFRI